ncbi:MAG TPA: BatD family protein [Steroidobacteraceae bacterium]|nr:BatD family protein [Steroidobacteraceae bacterium]
MRARRMALALWMAALLGAPALAAPQVSVQLAPQSIDTDGEAELTITVQGSDSAVEAPEVDGLQLVPEGQSSSVQFTNGTVTSSFTRTYRVIPERAGTFTIPSITVDGAHSAPQVLHVGAGAAGAAAPGQSGAGPGAAAAGGRAGGRGDVPDRPFLRVVLPKSRLYVGEVVPVQVKAYFRSGMGAQLNGPPALVSDAFTLGGLDQRPTQTEEDLGGRSYAVLTWSGTLGAIKAGSYPLDLQLPVTVSYTVRGSTSDMAARLRAFFGNTDPFLDDSDFAALFGHTVERPLTLKSQGPAIPVLALPEGAPPDFSGAVGQFDLAERLSADSGAVGDPLKLTLTVSGRGNFGRVGLAGLPASAQWRVYRPSERFTPEDATGMRGQKTFEQAVVPLQDGHEQLPPITFSYFDPEQARYMNRRTPPIDLNIAPGAPGTVAAAVPVTPSAPVAGPAGTLYPPAIEPGRFTRSLRPLLLAPWFLSLYAVPLLALGAGLSLRARSERRRHDPLLRRQAGHAAAVRLHLRRMDDALERGDAPAFFHSARVALQEKLAALWRMQPGQVDTAAVGTRLAEQGEAIRAVFKAAEAASYAGAAVPAEELRRWRAIVHAELARLESA